MIKLTQTSLDKLTELFTLAGYTIRHEKGNFKSGSCLISSGKLIVLNKFSPVEARVTFLVDALQKLAVDETLLDDRRRNFLKEVLAYRADASEEQPQEAAADSSEENNR
jgi:hypothetical protein